MQRRKRVWNGRERDTTRLSGANVESYALRERRSERRERGREVEAVRGLQARLRSRTWRAEARSSITRGGLARRQSDRPVGASERRSRVRARSGFRARVSLTRRGLAGAGRAAGATRPHPSPSQLPLPAFTSRPLPICHEYKYAPRASRGFHFSLINYHTLFQFTLHSFSLAMYQHVRILQGAFTDHCVALISNITCSKHCKLFCFVCDTTSGKMHSFCSFKSSQWGT